MVVIMILMLYIDQDYSLINNALKVYEQVQIFNQSPDMVILDEPTNNLDIQNIDILTKAVNEISGGIDCCFA
jgi:Fe-S cluster assembly ATPase SufC